MYIHKKYCYLCTQLISFFQTTRLGYFVSTSVQICQYTMSVENLRQFKTAHTYYT